MPAVTGFVKPRPLQGDRMRTRRNRLAEAKEHVIREGDVLLVPQRASVA
jgi:hypothetical protein